MNVESLKNYGRPFSETMTTLPDADVRVVTTDGVPVRGTRSDADGSIPRTTMDDVAKGTKVIVTAYDGQRSESTVVTSV